MLLLVGNSESIRPVPSGGRPHSVDAAFGGRRYSRYLLMSEARPGPTFA